MNRMCARARSTYVPGIHPPQLPPPRFPSRDEYAFSQCKWACLSLSNLRNPLAPSDKVNQAARECETWGWAQADNIISDRNDPKHISLRHCMGAACLARAVGCGCAQCLGHAREQYQYYEWLNAGKPVDQNGMPTVGNDLGQAQRGDYRNRIGLFIVGCRGEKGDIDPTCEHEYPGWNGSCTVSLPCKPSLSDPQVIGGCIKAWEDGRLDAFKPGIDLPPMDDNVPMW